MFMTLVLAFGVQGVADAVEKPIGSVSNQTESFNRCV